MREVNFSVPSSNKAAVGITTALYDRRALDCTSTLPLINSLNHLAYLTTSSARIREILTVDGGVEKLVSILKHGRTKDMMDTWKWNLAFQCVVNVGVRGSDGRASDNRTSENIRTRVVEADIVPVIATILDNYMQVVEKLRARSDEVDTRTAARHGAGQRVRFGAERGSSRRRDAPPPINIPSAVEETVTAADSESDPMDAAADAPSETEAGPSRLSVENDRRTFSNSRATPEHERESSALRTRSPRSEQQQQPRLRASTWAASDPALLRSREPTLLPFMRGRPDFSQPQTPTTPTIPPRNVPADSASSSRRTSASPAGRVEIQRQPSPMDVTQEPPASVEVDVAMDHGSREEPRIENDIVMPDLPERAQVLDTARQEDAFATNLGDSEADAFNLTPTAMDGSIIDPSATPTQRTLGFAAAEQAPFVAAQPAPELASPPFLNRLSLERSNAQGALVSVPRDEDIIMSLQLLAYVSKYCHLRTYFQQSHLVPKLQIGRELDAFDNAMRSADEVEEDDNENEFCQEDDYNIFPLVEKFTMRHHTHEMKYWAGVVMRNLCRKDKSRGDIRQCAYYKCGKWEEYARQFAKCRRCRQTKYCSKDCQKNAWVAHRHWCVQCSSSN